MENVEHAHPLTKLAKQELPEDNFSKSRLQLLQVRSDMARNQGGEWTEALKHLKTQLRYARSLKDWRVRLQTRLAIGDIHTRLGDTSQRYSII